MRKLLILVAVLAVPRVARAQLCAKPDILILLDISGSMNNSNKYANAKTGIESALSTYQGDANFGLAFFPFPQASDAYCNTENGDDNALALAVDFAPNNATAIESALSHTTPGGGNDTPILQALNGASAGNFFPDDGGDFVNHYVLLVTDGEQDCCRSDSDDPSLSGGNPAWDCTYSPKSVIASPDSDDVLESCQAEVNSLNIYQQVMNMAASGITTYAVGFGSDADPITLNRVACGAGTGISGCCDTIDAQNCRTSSDTNKGAGTPGSNDCDINSSANCESAQCFYTATDSNTLNQALSSIVAQINSGTCQGDDTLGINQGVCKMGSWACEDGQDVCSNSHGSDQIEQCDTLDHDCDGNYGNIFGSGVNGGLMGDTCATTCGQGHFYCQVTEDGGVEESQCVPDNPDAEGCNCVSGQCGPSLKQGCINEGSLCACKIGTQECNADGTWGSCVGAIDGTIETCNGIDDNCDGQIDEGTEKSCLTSCGTAGHYLCNGAAGLSTTCTPDSGSCDCNTGDTRPCGVAGNGCTQGVQVCQYGVWSTGCIGGTGGTTEVCNGLDDNCDGKIDNGATCPSGQTCVCGACEPDCAGTSCGNGGSCDSQGVCQIDYCPNGLVCDTSGNCGNAPPAAQTQTQSTPVVNDSPALAQNTKTVANGCGCHETSPLNGIFAMLFIGAIPFRRRFARR